MASVLLKASQIPLDERECFIFTGYRPTRGYLKTCLFSAFKIHNETLNIWTHFLPVVYFIYVLLCDDLTGEWKNMEHGQGSYRMIVYIYLVGILVLFGTSSFAHIFHCMSPRWRHICFMLDYAAISTYGMTSTVAYYYFFMPRPVNLWALGLLYSKEEVFLAASVSSALVALLLCCWTRINQTPMCHLIRTGAYVLPFCIGSVPAFLRCVRELVASLKELSDVVAVQWLVSLLPSMLPQPSDSDATNITDHAPQLPDYNDGEALTPLQFTIPYLYHVIYMATAAAFNISRVPERWWPGKFDVFGHSHQWFHVFIFLSVREQFWIIMDEISRVQSAVNAEPIISSAFNTCCAIVLLFLFMAAILYWFNQCLTPYLEAQDQEYSDTSKAQTDSEGNINGIKARTKNE